MARTWVVIDDYPFRFYGYEMRNYKDLIAFLIKKYKVCYFCGVKVVQYPYVEGEPFKQDQATIEHILPRPIRKKHEKTAKVLCCFNCNQERNKAFLKGKETS